MNKVIFPHKGCNDYLPRTSENFRTLFPHLSAPRIFFLLPAAFYLSLLKTQKWPVFTYENGHFLLSVPRAGVEPACP